MIDNAMEEKKTMEGIYDETMAAQRALKANFESEPNPQVTTSIYAMDLIEKDHKLLIQKIEQFSTDLKGIQDSKFAYQISSLVIFVLVGSLGGILGYVTRREFIPFTASLLLLLFSVPAFVIAGLETSYTFLSIDFCASVGNSITSGIVPNENKGLGTYFSCPSKDTMRGLATANYQMKLSFDYLYGELEKDLEPHKDEEIGFDLVIEGRGAPRRNNTFFKELIGKIKDNPVLDEKEEKPKMIGEIENIMLINTIIAGLQSMSYCRTGKNSINYIEEKYCHPNHAYLVRNVIFLFLSSFGFVLVAIGLNKFIIVMRSYFAKSLRGKGEFNKDIIDEDEGGKNKDDDDDD